MGKLIYICESCLRARATERVDFPSSGAVMRVCKRCKFEDPGPE